VLRPGGTLLFNVWDRIEENEFANTVTAALADLFPTNAPLFMVRTPHGYFHDDCPKSLTSTPDLQTLRFNTPSTQRWVAKP
jgi:hypothetical protein